MLHPAYAWYPANIYHNVIYSDTVRNGTIHATSNQTIQTTREVIQHTPPSPILIYCLLFIFGLLILFSIYALYQHMKEERRFARGVYK